MWKRFPLEKPVEFSWSKQGLRKDCPMIDKCHAVQIDHVRDHQRCMICTILQEMLNELRSLKEDIVKKK